MIRHLFEFKGLLSLVFLSLFLQTQPAFAAGSKLVILGTGNETPPDTVVNKENAISNRIAGEPTETIVVTLSDEKVRHLIEALTKQPKQGPAIKAEEKVGGLAGLIKKIRFVMVFFGLQPAAGRCSTRRTEHQNPFDSPGVFLA